MIQFQFQCWRCGRLVPAEQVRRQSPYWPSPDRVNVCPKCYARQSPIGLSVIVAMCLAVALPVYAGIVLLYFWLTSR